MTLTSGIAITIRCLQILEVCPIQWASLHEFLHYGRTKKEAREKLKQFLDDRASGIDTSYSYTFDDWADIWFEHQSGQYHRNLAA